ncbi:MAG TPA: matrixin family metalloprotease, partial [Candidatus Nitrosotenuis sp.]
KEDKDKREQKKAVDNLDHDEAVDNLRREEDDAMDNLRQEQNEAVDDLEQSQDKAVDDLEQSQDKAVDKIKQGQDKAVDKLEQGQDKAMDKLERGQDKAVDDLGREYSESHDEFKGEIKESIERLKKQHQITQDSLETRHAETRELLKNTGDSKTLKSRNIQTEKEVISHHIDEENALQRDYQSSIDRLDAENNEALSRHKQTQDDITEKLKLEQKDALDKLRLEEDEAVDKIGREQKEAVVKLGRDQDESIGKLKLEQKEAREKLRSTQLETKNRLERLRDMATHAMVKKRTILIVSMAVLVAGVGFAVYSTYVIGFIGQQYQITNLGKLPTGYVIQNLRGDTIDTWLSWRLVSGSTLHVGITNAAKYPERIPLIKEVILSEESIDVDDSLLHKGPPSTISKYYVGWQGALKQASTKPMEFYIPTNLVVVESARGEGEITIILTDEKNGDGYSGYTKSIADDSQNQILKSTITIYDVSSLNDEQFRTLLRHEFGHALGLAHSTAPEDLMAPIIQTSYPYISECDIDTIVQLYDDGKNSQVVCEK